MTNLEEARDLLKRRGNSTDNQVFERLIYFTEAYGRMTYQSDGGTTRKKSKFDLREARSVMDELALILSWTLVRTATFWQSAAYEAVNEPGSKLR